MPAVSISHLVCFVLVVFSVNVLVLAYLTGALGGWGGLDQVMTSLTRSLSTRLQRPTRPVPPWQQPQPHHVPIASSSSISLPPCASGVSWRNQQSLFCRHVGASSSVISWVEYELQSGLERRYSEVRFSPVAQEAVMMMTSNEKAVVALVIKRTTCFLGEARPTWEASLRTAFDHVHLANGQWTMNSKAAAPPPPPPPLSRATKLDTDKDCDRYWSVAGQSGFCRLKNRDGAQWVEVDDHTRRVKFTFTRQLALPTNTTVDDDAVALFDEQRMVALVLLRTFCLVAHPKSASNAIQSALDTDEVLLSGGRWREQEHYGKIPPAALPLGRTADTAQVLLMISAFHDDLCSNTLREAFSKAKFPDRVRISVVDQVSEESCLDVYCQDEPNDCPRRSQVHEIRVDKPHSRGVMFARFLQQTPISPQDDFCLQIDSHMVFPAGWDEIAIADWTSTQNEMAVMTTYPNRALDVDNQNYSPIRCNTVWNSHVVACGTAANNIRHKQPVPYLTAFFGAGIAFSKCHANVVVPYDPWMPFLFKGEEYNRGARLWTHGYDLYAPRMNYAYHFYDDDPRPGRFANIKRDRSFFGADPNSNALLRQSEFRWQAVMGMKDENGKNKRNLLKQASSADVGLFGLGTKRSLREFELFSGVNLAQHTTKDICHLVGKMHWVPWDTNNHRVWGANCAVDRRECCHTTLDRALAANAQTRRYMNQSNQEFADKVEASPAATVENRKPIFSVGWTQAQPKPC